MKQKKWYEKGIKRIGALLLACVMLLSMNLTVAAADYQEDRMGSIALTLAVTEEGETTPVPDILLSLYKVGTVETQGAIRFVLDERLADIGVDFGAMDTPEQVQAAAQKLEAAAGNAGIEAVSVRTDRNGKVFFGNLEKAMYLIVQVDGQDKCMISPMLLSVPYSQDGMDWEFDIAASPKAELKENSGSLTVEKQVLTAEDGKWVETKVKEKTYYVGLFLDEEATLPYGEVKRIVIRNSSYGRAVWKGLPEGTYYLRETDSRGAALPLGEEFTEEDGDRATCVITLEGEQTTRLRYQSGEQGDKSAVVKNLYKNSPEKPPVTPQGEEKPPVTPQGEEAPPAKTGDDSNLAGWIWSALLSGIIIVILAKYLEKHRNSY